jgi:hypothetical protein
MRRQTNRRMSFETEKRGFHSFSKLFPVNLADETPIGKNKYTARLSATCRQPQSTNISQTKPVKKSQGKKASF